jgi:glycerol-1-phosphate dehydrogenase [NAD(P)+]
MNLPLDLTNNEAFWKAARHLPGFPAGDDIPLRTMLFESGAIFRLPEVLLSAGAAPDRPLLLVVDPTRMRRGQESLKLLVHSLLLEAGWKPEQVVLEPDDTGQVHTDLRHIHALQTRLVQGTAVLALGSGVVCDISKHACFLHEQEGGEHIPFVIAQTANSVNAFTSNMAPTFVDGVKRTLSSRYADALVCDLETLRDAPMEMTVAGVGDLLSAAVSFPDWYLAHRLGMDPGYSALAQKLMGKFDQILLEQAAGIRTGSLDAVSCLARLIAASGLCMSLAHATTPFSGYEHVISHIMDLQNELAGRPLAQHGSQVALAAVLAAGAYQIFLNEFDPEEVDPDACYPPARAMQPLVYQTFDAIDRSGRAGMECWRDYEVKLETWRTHRLDFEGFLNHWDLERVRLRGLAIPPARLLEILRAVGAPLRFDQLDPPFSEEQVKFAFLNAPLMRKRLTIGDLFIYLDSDRDALWKRVWPLLA